MLVRVQQRNQVVQNDCGRRLPVKLANARHRVIAIPFEQAAHDHYIGLLREQKRFTNPFRRFAAQTVVGVNLPGRRRSIPYPDIFLRQQPVECNTNRFDRLWKLPAQRKDDFMLAALTRQREPERQGVASDAPKPAFGLCTLHINDDTHQRFPDFLIT